MSKGGFFCHTEIVKHSFSHGSTLGSLLFLIYINDLTNAREKSLVYHFADDNKLKFVTD